MEQLILVFCSGAGDTDIDICFSQGQGFGDRKSFHGTDNSRSRENPHYVLDDA